MVSLGAVYGLLRVGLGLVEGLFTLDLGPV